MWVLLVIIQNNKKLSMLIKSIEPPVDKTRSVSSNKQRKLYQPNAVAKKLET